MRRAICRAVYLLIVILAIGCSAKTDKRIIARVGDAVLTIDDIVKGEDTLGVSRRAKIASWVEQEILHQEAVKSGIESSEKFKDLLAGAKRQLAIQNYLEEQLYGDTLKISDPMIESYYLNNQEEFYIREDMAKINLVTFKTREAAASFAARVSKAVQWNDAPAETRQDSGISASLHEKIFTQHTLYPAELWKVVLNLVPGEISFPVKTTEGFSVMQLLAWYKSGSHSDFSLAFDEVYQRVLIERRRSRYNQLLENLRRKYQGKIFISNGRSDDIEKAQ